MSEDDFEGTERFLESESVTEVENRTIIHNYIIYCDLQCTLDLFRIAQLTQNAWYDPRKSPGLLLRRNNGQITCRIFKAGGMSITGVKTKEEGLKTAKIFLRVIKKFNNEAKMKKIEVKNIMATSHCNFEVDIESVSYDPKFKHLVKYNPEVFSGIRVTIPSSNVRANVFVSGKMTIVGAKDESELEKAVDFVIKIMEQHKKESKQSLNNFQILQENENDIEKIREEQIMKKLKKEKKKKDPFYGKKPKL